MKKIMIPAIFLASMFAIGGGFALFKGPGLSASNNRALVEAVLKDYLAFAYRDGSWDVLTCPLEDLESLDKAQEALLRVMSNSSAASSEVITKYKESFPVYKKLCADRALVYVEAAKFFAFSDADLAAHDAEEDAAKRAAYVASARKKKKKLNDAQRNGMKLIWRTAIPTTGFNPFRYHVYIIRDGKRGPVLHVGQSTQLGKRLKNHEDMSPGAVVYWAEVEWGFDGIYMDSIERYLGDHYRPQDRHPAVTPIAVNLPF